ncbi:MAG: MBL fold metallo-hydrolase [Deltaproteobacteria bacterium]|nr:MAG: MBL fold metallo-hydrolase [Deltaproteobacteria bacterium]
MIEQPIEDIYLIELPQPRKGYESFIGSWVLRRDPMTVLVDPGPRSTIPLLLQSLETLEIETLDMILLTHIHIDHAGGTGLLLERYPEAAVICHPKGIEHLINPERLWENTKKVLGDLAGMYGSIAAVPASRIRFQEIIDVGAASIRVLMTPGHAAHHLSFQIDDILFAGEALGVYYQFDKNWYLRPATPPVFRPDVYRQSIFKLADLDVCHLCFGHYGYSSNVQAIFDTARDQLERWLDVVEMHVASGKIKSTSQILKTLLKKDPILTAYPKLPRSVQARERYFCQNSITGMLGAVSG